MLIIARAWGGPIHLGSLRMDSPLPAESFFALCFLVLALAEGTQPTPGASADPAPERPWLLAALVVVLVSIVFARNLADPFLSDDYILVSRATADPSTIGAAFRTPGGDGAFRPVGALYFGAVKLWAKTDPLKWHVCSLCVHLVNCLLIFWVASKLWPDRLIALGAALVFGLHGTRPEVVTWTAGSFDLIATLFVLSSAALFFSPVRRFRVLLDAAALLLLLLGVLTKESAYVYPFLILGLAAAAGRLNRRTARFTLIATLECAALFAYRWFLFHGPGGYVDSSTGRPQILSMHFVPTLKALLSRIWAILFFPIDWAAAIGVKLALAVAIGCGVLLYVMASKLRISGRISLVLVATVIACMLPVLPLALIDPSGIGSRILYLPSVAFCVWLANSLRGRLTLGALTLSMAGILAHNLSAWHETALLADRACRVMAAAPAPRAAVQGLPRSIGGAYFFANGFDECVQMKRENMTEQSR